MNGPFNPRLDRAEARPGWMMENGSVEGSRAAGLNRSRDVPDVIGEATCSRNHFPVPGPFGLNIHCSSQRRRRDEIIPDQRPEPTGSNFPVYHPSFGGGGGGGGIERNGNHHPMGRGLAGRDGSSGTSAGCSLCQFRNQPNPMERLPTRDGGHERGSRDRQRQGEAEGLPAEWRIMAPVPDNHRLPPSVEEQRTRTRNRPDIAPDPNEAPRSLPSNRVVSASPYAPMLPDILNSHRIPPPYDQVTAQPTDSPQPAAAAAAGGGYLARSSGHRPLRPLSVIAHLNGAEQKDCCSRQFCIRCFVAMTTFRWLLVSFGVLGVGCVAAGIVLGILQMMSSGSYLLHSIVFIGLGVFLLLVILVGWRCTPSGREPCHLFFNFADDGITSVTRTRNFHRRHRCRNDSHQWFGGVLYPEFRNRCPPPTYNASAQDYQHHLLMAQIQLAAAATIHNTDYVGLPTSPPPTYRSRPATLQRSAAAPHPPPPHHQRPGESLPPAVVVAAAPTPASNESHYPVVVQSPPSYNTLPTRIWGGGIAESNGGAAQREPDVRCGRCTVPPRPEIAGQSGSNVGGGGGGGGGTSSRLRHQKNCISSDPSTHDPLLRSWTTGGSSGSGSSGNSRQSNDAAAMATDDASNRRNSCDDDFSLDTAL